MIVSSGLPVLMPATAKSRPFGCQSPAEWMNWRLSKCGSTALFVRRRFTSPVRASAPNISMEKRSLCET